MGLNSEKQPRLYCIPKRNDIENYLAYAEEEGAAFEYNDFFLPFLMDQPGFRKETLDFYRSLGRDTSGDTVHGAFLDVTVHSDDSLIRKASDYRVRESMDVAAELGARAVIFHTNQIPNFRSPSYLDNWVKRNTEYWSRLMEDYPGQQIFIENMFDMWPDLLTRLAKNMEGNPQFGVCFDIAHANIGVAPVESWFDNLAPYIRHMHINDNDGSNDSHDPVGTMTVPWNLYDSYLESAREKPSILIEVNNFENLKKSTEYMKSHRMYPFNEK